MGRGRRNRTLARAPRLEKTICLALKLFVVDGSQPSVLAFVIFEDASAGGTAVLLVNVTHMDAVPLGRSGGEANRISRALLGQPSTRRMTKIAMIAEFVIFRANQHLSGSSAYAAKAGRQRQTIGKVPRTIEALGRDEKRAGHENESYCNRGPATIPPQPCSNLEETFEERPWTASLC
jgi:hypothetical protein